MLLRAACLETTGKHPFFGQPAPQQGSGRLKPAFGKLCLNNDRRCQDPGARGLGPGGGGGSGGPIPYGGGGLATRNTGPYIPSTSPQHKREALGGSTPNRTLECIFTVSAIHMEPHPTVHATPSNPGFRPESSVGHAQLDPLHSMLR